MNEELREALEAVNAGQPDKARVILAEYLRDDPGNIPAWVLLSKLATTESQKSAFLRKIIDLDPQHAYAREAMAELGGAEPPTTIGEEVSDLEPVSEEVALQDADVDVAFEGALAEEEAPSELASLGEPFSQESVETLDFEEEVPATVDDEARAVDAVAPDFTSSETFVEDEPDEDLVDWLSSDSPDIGEEEDDADWLDFDDLEPFDEEGAEEGELDWADFIENEEVETFEEDVSMSSDALPSWVDTGESEDTLFEAPAAQSPAQTDPVEEDDLPAWLRGDDGDWLVEEDVDTEFAALLGEANDAMVSSSAEDSSGSEMAEKEARISAAMSQEAPQPTDLDVESSSGRGWLLGLLIVVAAVVFLLLVYAVLTFML